ncbi:L-ribulose-5-phosphate 4-epimerase AraD [Sediminicola luteus]|uniref:L-ribulose-5-phosphate 4-epimerase AraD n=1 Tax=Sediminicola luteus TaxID=319238 RepID=UPI003742EEAA
MRPVDPYGELRQEAYDCNMRLPELGLVLFTFGNASVADRELGVFAIKPSGVPYTNLKPSDMVIVDFDGNIVDGALRPSSDTKTHAVLYKHWKEVGGIVHTHSTYATAWAQTGLDIPIYGTTHADHMTVNIPCAPVMDAEMISGDYEFETGHQILKAFATKNLSPKEVEMCLIANHAPFCWGPTGDKAVYNSGVCEELAKMAFLTKQIRPNAPMLPDALKRKHFERKHGTHAYYGQQ